MDMESEIFTQKIETIEADKHFQKYYSNNVKDYQDHVENTFIKNNEFLYSIKSKKRNVGYNGNEHENEKKNENENHTKKMKK